MHRIEIAGIECQARIGVPELERKQPQRILLDVELRMDLSAAADRDDFHLTVDYEKVMALVQEVVEQRPWSLIESLAAAVCNRILAETPAEQVQVRVVKFPLALQGQVRHVAATATLRRGD